MSEQVKNLIFSGKFNDDSGLRYRNGKLFVGVLGCEYAIPYFSHLNLPAVSFDIKTLHASHNIPPTILQYSYINRTQDTDEYAYSDAILPVYLRFQPDLEDALNDAASNVASGKDYMSQYIEIEQPTVQIEGRQEVISASGTTSYVLRSIEFTIPINPPPRRVIRLSLQDGLVAYLGKVR